MDKKIVPPPYVVAFDKDCNCVDLNVPQENGQWITLASIFVPDFPGGKEKAEATLGFVARACNNHAALIEALEETKSALSAWMEIADKEDERDSDYDACHKANAVLAKAEGK